MKKLLLILALIFTFPVTMVFADVEPINYDFTFVDNHLWDYDNGKFVEDTNFACSYKLQLLTDTIEMSGMDFHSILFWNKNQQFIGYYTNDTTGGYTNDKWIADISTTTITPPDGTKYFAIQINKIGTNELTTYTEDISVWGSMTHLWIEDADESWAGAGNPYTIQWELSVTADTTYRIYYDIYSHFNAINFDDSDSYASFDVYYDLTGGGDSPDSYIYTIEWNEFPTDNIVEDIVDEIFTPTVNNNLYIRMYFDGNMSANDVDKIQTALEDEIQYGTWVPDTYVYSYYDLHGFTFTEFADYQGVNILELNQLIINGDFSVDSNSDGLADNWSLYQSQTPSLSSGAQRVYGNGINYNMGLYHTNISVISSHYYYYYSDIEYSWTPINGYYYNSISVAPTLIILFDQHADVFTSISQSSATGTASFYTRLSDQSSAVIPINEWVQFNEIMLFDLGLTTPYTLSQIDSNIAYYGYLTYGTHELVDVTDSGYATTVSNWNTLESEYAIIYGNWQDGISFATFETLYASGSRTTDFVEEMTVIERIENFIDGLGYGDLPYILISIFIMGGIGLTFALVRIKLPIILITEVALFAMFAVFGWMPLWLVLLLVMIFFVLAFFMIKGLGGGGGGGDE